LLDLFTKRDSELDDLFDEVFSVAMDKGFQVEKLEIRCVVHRIAYLTRTKTEKNVTIALAFPEQNIIMVFDEPTKHRRKDKLLLLVMLAHELGHIVDGITERKGHPLFENIRDETNEMFADAFAAYLFSKFAVVKMRDTFQSDQFRATRFAQLDLNC
jgi:Zn-dependent peptidase ImmA (M78 family)